MIVIDTVYSFLSQSHQKKYLVDIVSNLDELLNYQFHMMVEMLVMMMVVLVVMMVVMLVVMVVMKVMMMVTMLVDMSHRYS